LEKITLRAMKPDPAAIWDSLPLLVFSLNEELNLVYVSKYSEGMLGYTPEEALEESGWLLHRVHPHDRRELREALLSAMHGEVPVSLECRFLHRKGHVVHGIVRALPPTPHPGEPPRLEGVVVDISDRILNERARVQSEKVKTLGAISAEVAHTVRNPLMTIAGFARRLEKKAPELPEAGIILVEALRLENLLNRIGDYLKPTEFGRRECSVNIIVADCLQLLAPEMDEKGVRRRLELDEELPPLVVDPDLLGQVVINLIRNGVKCLEKDAVMEVRTFESNKHVQIELDYHAGVAHETDPDKIFLPFDESYQNLDMPVAYRLVKQMNGVLSFATEHGRAVFTVSLPKIVDAESAPGMGNGTEPPEEDRSTFAPHLGVLTRSVFDDLLERKFRGAALDQRPLALLLIRLDNYDSCRLGYGLKAASDCLSNVAEVLTRALPQPWHYLLRYEGQEFAVILPDTDRQEAEELAEALRARVASLTLTRTDIKDCDRYSLTIGGAVCTPSSRASASDILAAATKALFLAGQHSPDTVRFLDIEPEK
jgi:two-component system, NtrC family, sensor histidine kinase HydH